MTVIQAMLMIIGAGFLVLAVAVVMTLAYVGLRVLILELTGEDLIINPLVVNRDRDREWINEYQRERAQHDR